ncbi:olfactory receptor 12D2-like [Rhinatrema bivittatum]|uniref:olfactory receptor 12D2-like n=1 Tax=Rhinatrema bivittatum TaxID=194408 RepID=UPI0011286680|nr:olfactory receptor 12D2-like [Rhinatrema bivittatum]
MALRGHNGTLVTEFLLLSLSDFQELQVFLFIIFIIIYITNILGNIVIIIITQLDPHLHTPMYFFLGILSFLDIFYSSVTVPKMFINFLVVDKGISYQGCITQLFFFHFLGSTEACLLSVMGYDRYIAIYNPLRYTIIMNQRLCVQLAATMFLIGFLHALLHATMMSRVTFCGPNQVNHFFCDIAPMLKLSCSNTSINELLLFCVTGSIVLGCFSLTLISYFLIISTIMKMHSAEGRRKAFSTCVSHLTVVSLHYGCAGIMYLRPKSQYSLQQDRVIAVLYTAVTPMLNPLIYTLRNKQVKTALRQAICSKIFVNPE